MEKTFDSLPNLLARWSLVPATHVSRIQRVSHVVVHEEPSAKIGRKEQEKAVAEVLSLLLILAFLEHDPVSVFPLPIRHDSRLMTNENAVVPRLVFIRGHLLPNP